MLTVWGRDNRGGEGERQTRTERHGGRGRGGGKKGTGRRRELKRKRRRMKRSDEKRRHIQMQRREMKRKGDASEAAKRERETESVKRREKETKAEKRTERETLAEISQLLVSWYFEPSQPQRITSRLKTMFNLSLIYSARKSSNHKFSQNHKICPDTNLHKAKQTQTSNIFFPRISPFGISPV